MVYVSLAELISVSAITIVVSFATAKVTTWNVRRKYRKACTAHNLHKDAIEAIDKAFDSL